MTLGLPVSPLCAFAPRRGFLAVVLASFSCGCSIPWYTPPPSTEAETHAQAPLTGVELYMAKTNSRETEFEQIKMTDSLLFVECGKLKGGRALPTYQDVQPLQPTTLETLSRSLLPLTSAITASNPQLPPPGSNANFFDPGIFKLSVHRGSEAETVQCDLNSIGKPHDPRAKTLRKLAALVRGVVSQAPCGNKTFYGVPWR